MSDMHACENCGARFNLTLIEKCPFCDGSTPPEVKVDQEHKRQESKAADPVVEADPLLAELRAMHIDLVKASNRTTHAVRAMVRFILVQLSFTTAAAVLFAIADSFVDPARCAYSGEQCSPNTALTLLAMALFITGIVVSSRLAWAELEQSNVPDFSSGSRLRP